MLSSGHQEGGAKVAGASIVESARLFVRGATKPVSASLQKKSQGILEIPKL